MGVGKRRMEAHLLIVEDDVFVQKLLVAYLSKLGYRVSQAGSGRWNMHSRSLTKMASSSFGNFQLQLRSPFQSTAQDSIP